MDDAKGVHEGEEASIYGEVSFGTPVWPTPSAGNGKIRPNSLRTGKGQGQSSTRRMCKCKQCGYVFDSARTSTDTGTFEGNGAAGKITTSQPSGKTLSGDTVLDNVGDTSYNRGAGCPFCLAKNIRS